MPLPLLAVPLIAAGVSSAVKGIQSAVRAKEAKKEMDRLKEGLVDPSYELPTELMSAYNRQLGMSTEMPGQQLARYGMEMDYSRAMGDASKASMTAQDRLAVATSLGQQQMMGGLKLAQTAAQYQGEAEQEKMRGISQLAGQIGQYRDVMYRENELNPFLRTSAAISALREKRYKESNNTFNAFSNLGQIVAGGITQFGGGGGGLGGGGGGGDMGSIASSAANAITGAGSMQNSQFGNYGNPAGGSGMGANWQNQIGGSYGGGYYDPSTQTWNPG
jgi:hypothetical protein